MKSAFDNGSPPITRRRFGQWGLVAAASGVGGCGGGGDEPLVQPPAKAGALELVAGALGGGGFALQQGAMARLPGDLSGPAFNSQGDFQFVSGSYDCRVGRRSRQGVSSFSPAPWDFHGLLFDALDRYLVTGGGGTIEYLQGETPVRLAGGASGTGLIDGVGTGARLFSPQSLLLAKNGLVYFIDEVSQQGFQPVLRTLAADGTVKTLLPMPDGSQLLESPSGGVRRYTHSPDASVPKEWAELVLEGNAYQWRVLPSQWAFDQWTPLQKVQGAVDVYWAVSAAQGGPEFSIAQIDLSGRSVAAGWKVRGRAVAVVSQGPWQLGAASLFVACSGSYEDGSEVVECRLEPTGAVVQRWLGMLANSGREDGQGQQARFDFVWGVEALPDGAGGLVLLEYRRGGSSAATPVPALRSVSAPGQVSTWAVEPRGFQVAIAYGYLVGHEGGTKNTLVRTPVDGKSAWQTWTSSSHVACNRGEDVFLRTDTTGRLWFAKRYSPQPGAGDAYFGRAKGNALVGTIDANGQVQVVAGDPQALYTPQTYPSLAQRPWYMDIADMAFEGGSAQVSWVLCNRVELDGATSFVRFHPELVRIDAQGSQRFALSLAIDPRLPEFYQEPFKQICVLPGRPGEVFLSSACGVHRWTQAKGLELLAGQNEPTPGGVFSGPLPGGLNLVKFLASGPDRNSLYVGSENSVLRLVLPE
ncbi:MAG: hypothetical protein H3C29_10800 [Simplicispira suum]|uniref:hypothetical protein n=1 Tax=Simplicispira suum TaxID=2109915 RepID=UPI001C6B510D|nr:hypothetical protein [Simplicispira suum]MBW7833692.1 hypothetical protein [Simplicispira suum]